MHDALLISGYRNEADETVGAMQLTGGNFKTVQALLGAEIWHSGQAPALAVGLAVGEYEEKTYVPFGWWITIANGKIGYLAHAAFINEYEEI